MRRIQGEATANPSSRGEAGLANMLAIALLLVLMLLLIGSIYITGLDSRQENGQTSPEPTPTGTLPPIPTDPKEIQDYLDALIRREQELDGRMEAIRDIAGIRQRIIAELDQALDDTGLLAEIDPLTGDIRLVDTLLFGVSVDTINEEGQEYLRVFIPAYLSVLFNSENRPYIDHVIIEGHSDDVGSYDNNLALSHRRAMSVANFIFQSNLHILEGGDAVDEYLAVSGRASSQLVMDEGGINRQASRRVEFKFRLKDEALIRRMLEIHEGELSP
ncbi:MAG: OmpA family protein [Clostridia bacterium]